MSRKKYVIYKIKIVYSDGSVEYIQDDNYSTGDYSSMCELYKKTQEDFCDKDCKIILLGVNSNGSNSLIKERDFSKISEEEREIYDTSFIEYAYQIRDILDKMHKKKNYHTQMLDAVEKKDSLVDHKIETFIKKKWDSEDEKLQEKIKIFDESESIKRERRLHKDELEVIFEIRNSIDLSEMYDAFDIEVKDNSKFQYLDEEMIKSLGLMKEYYYATEKDRVCKVKALKRQYDKVKVDVVNRKIICYNKATTKF